MSCIVGLLITTTQVRQARSRSVWSSPGFPVWPVAHSLAPQASVFFTCELVVFAWFLLRTHCRRHHLRPRARTHRLAACLGTECNFFITNISEFGNFVEIKAGKPSPSIPGSRGFLQLRTGLLGVPVALCVEGLWGCASPCHCSRKGGPASTHLCPAGRRGGL